MGYIGDFSKGAREKLFLESIVELAFLIVLYDRLPVKDHLQKWIILKEDEV